jgi:hypothetical protein
MMIQITSDITGDSCDNGIGARAEGGKREDAENHTPWQEQVQVLKNKVLRRDMRIEQLTRSEKGWREAAATVRCV